MRNWLLVVGFLSALACAPSFASAEDGTDTDAVRRYEYYFMEGIRLEGLGKHDAAYEMFRHCQALNPRGAAALAELSNYYWQLKQSRQGMEAMVKAAELEPGNYWYSQGLGSIYMQQNKTDEAIALLEDMAQRFPKKTGVLYGLLQLYDKVEDFDKLLGILNRLETVAGMSEPLTMQKYAVLMRQKKQTEALAEVQKLADKYPNELRYRVVLGDAYLQMERSDEARDIYQGVLEKEPDNALAMYAMATYYEQTGQAEAYDRQLNSVLLNKKVDTDVREEVMRRLILRNEEAGKDSTVVLSLFERIMEQEPDEPTLPLLYVSYLYTKGMDSLAVPVLKQVLQIAPSHTAARMTLLGEAVKREDYNQVIDLCRTGVVSNPDQLEFHYYLALGYNQEQQTDSVIAVCRRALDEVSPESDKTMVSDFYAILGDALHGKNLMKETFAAYDSALVYNPNNIMALNNYAYYLSLEKVELDRAEEMSYKTVKDSPDNATYLDTYAWILFVKGNYPQAKIYIDMTLENDNAPGAVVLEHCGDIYYMSGEPERALDFWKQAKDKGSDSETIERKIKQRRYIP